MGEKKKKRSKTIPFWQKGTVLSEGYPHTSGPTGVSPEASYYYQLDSAVMDSTSVIEISIMQNENYAHEIISNIMKPAHVEDLITLKQTNVPEFLSAGKKHIIDICRGIDSLETHTSMFVVLAMMQIGRVLNEIYEALDNDRSKYSKWVRENFGSQHIRYFQQSRQLVRMGDFAEQHAALGKNRLLQVNRIRSKDGYKDIVENHPPPDITQDRQGSVFKEHMDAVITLYHLREGGVDVADFDQAYIMSCENKQWIEQKKIKKIKEWLDGFPTREEKQENFDNYVLNRMSFPSQSDYSISGNAQSLNTILSNLIIYYENRIQPDSIGWIRDVNAETFERARRIMRFLSEVTLPQNSASSREA